jgi:hypothetical protein
MPDIPKIWRNLILRLNLNLWYMPLHEEFGSPAPVRTSAHTTKENSGMNKSQLTEALAKAENITLKKAELVVNAIFENMANALVQKERIEIRGFGSFKVKFYKGYKG